jgi:hypothetical protein
LRGREHVPGVEVAGRWVGVDPAVVICPVGYVLVEDREVSTPRLVRAKDDSDRRARLTTWWISGAEKVSQLPDCSMSISLMVPGPVQTMLSSFSSE